MPYEIHLMPHNSLVGDSAWIDAVADTPGVRISGSDNQATLNPKTAEKLAVSGSSLDAEIYFPDEGTWQRALFWRNGHIAINARFDFGNPEDPAWCVVSALAKRLRAILRGEEGEEYDSASGEVSRRPFKQERTDSRGPRQLKGHSFQIIFPIDTHATFEIWAILSPWLSELSLLQSSYLVCGHKKAAKKVEEYLGDRHPNHGEVTGEGFEMHYGSPRRYKHSLLWLKWDKIDAINYDPLIEAFSNEMPPVMAWAYDNEYHFWQNARDPLQYETRNRKYDHLPMVPRGDVAPFNKELVIDTSANLGRRVLADGYVEAVGGTMYMGPEFWARSGASFDTVARLPFVIEHTEINGMHKFVFNDSYFRSDTGIEGEIQRELRRALYPSA